MTNRVSTTLSVTRAVEAITTPERIDVQKAARTIIDYVLEHPGARDTARGIAEWWIHHTLATTVAAIEFLHEQGLLIQAQRNDQILFSRDPSLGKLEMKAIQASISSKL